MVTSTIIAASLMCVILIIALWPRSSEGYQSAHPMLNPKGNSILRGDPSSDTSAAVVGGASARNSVVIEGGRTSDGKNVGFSAINFNGKYDNGERRTDTAKSRWRIGVDQRGGGDTMFIDQQKTNGSFWTPLRMDGANLYVGTTKMGHASTGDWTDRAPLSVVKQSVGASFRGGTHWSHFPWSDENVYIRPGVDGAHIKIGDAGNPTSVQIKDSWFPYVDGNTYIRARSTNNAIKIGDALAGRIELGAPVDAGKVSVKQLCVGSACVNEAQFRKIMQSTGA